MSRPTKHYHLWKNKRRGGVFYYRLSDGAWRSTGCRSKTEAEKVAQYAWKAGEVAVAKKRPRVGTVRDLLEPYYQWEQDPRIKKRRLEGKRIAKQHAAHSRRLLELYVWEDPIAEITVRKLSIWRRGGLPGPPRG